ncbi:MAG TPA: DUF6159 family protein [Steroidobacter sp.]
MFERFSRSWQLVKASGAVLRQDKELLLFPLFSAIAMILVSASFITPLVVGGTFVEPVEDSANATTLLIVFLFYLVQYFVIFFFNSALVGAAMIRLDGGDPTVRDGLRIASSRFVQILGYAAIAATVGLILRIIEERAGFIGRWIAGLLGLAFTVATFLAVPILVSQNVGPVEAVKDSATLLKKTWGENVIGNVGMGLVFFIFYFGVIGLGVALVIGASQASSPALVVLVVAAVVLALVALALVQSALQGVYSAALYRYATNGNVGEAFSGTLLSSAFKPKR